MSLVRSELASWLASDPYYSPFQKGRAEVDGLRVDIRNELVARCALHLASPSGRAAEEDRVSLVKTLVALFPHSAPEIRAWLRTFSSDDVYEVHFSLFCFLSEIADIPSLAAYRGEVAEAVKEYLAAVPSESALAAWMAGDMLGDHWPVTEALPLLLDLATTAKYPAGRKGAIHGLAHVLARVGGDLLVKDRILALLQAVARDDSDQSVRRYSGFAVKEYNQNRTV